MNKNYDIIVLGGGPAGYSAAIRSAQLGSSVLLIEKDAAGGTCLNRGCIPTKFMWESLHLKKKLGRAADYGISLEIKEYGLAGLIQKKDRTVDILTKGLANLLKGYSITIAEGSGYFISANQVEVKEENGNINGFSAAKVIIASGSAPSTLAGLSIDHDKFIDSTDMLKLAQPPKTLLVIGGGAIGVEFASIMAGMGSEVTIIEKEPQLMPAADHELALEIRKLLERQSIRVLTGNGSYQELAEKSEKVLVAVGRKPDVSALGLAAAGIAFTGKGIAVNEFQETNVAGVYAAGDCTGKNYLAYVSQAEGVCAAENAHGLKNTVNRSAVPWVVFTDPPAAGAGAREIDFTRERVAVGRFQLSANSRSMIESERSGWAKIVLDKDSGKILGGCIIGPGADEIIPVLALAVRHGLTANEISRELFFHPSISEALHCACEDALNKCVDLPRKENSK